jgi:siroheme synthase
MATVRKATDELAVPRQTGFGFTLREFAFIVRFTAAVFDSAANWISTATDTQTSVQLMS